jgi:CubicO group peptidase (beta-lactamase class C family)
MSARDMARFGLLYLREGQWQNRQIIPKSWVRESTTSYSDVGEDGYGYMWWIDVGEGYSARGAGGHFIMIIPTLDLVIVHRADTDRGKEVAGPDFGRLLDLILSAKLRRR